VGPKQTTCFFRHAKIILLDRVPRSKSQTGVSSHNNSISHQHKQNIAILESLRISRNCHFLYQLSPRKLTNFLKKKLTIYIYIYILPTPQEAIYFYVLKLVLKKINYFYFFLCFYCF
jgi:hypothetical protein